MVNEIAIWCNADLLAVERKREPWEEYQMPVATLCEWYRYAMVRDDNETEFDRIEAVMESIGRYAATN